MTDFQRHFIRPMIQENASDALVFIEILANMAEESPLLMQAMIEALRQKAEWGQAQAEGIGALRQLHRIADEEGKKGGTQR